MLRSRTYDELPALRVRGPHLRGALRRVTVGWAFGSVWMVCIGNPTMLSFGDLAGFTASHWGLLTAIGFAATLGQLPAAYVIERTGFRKWQFIYAMTAGRGTWLLLAMMPLALHALPAPTVVAMTLVLILLARTLDQFGLPAWTTWMGDLIPPRIRGRYFAWRHLYTVLVQIAATLALGFLLDRVRRGPEGPLAVADEPLLVATLAGVFLVAGVTGILDILTFLPIREVLRPRPAERLNLRRLISEPLQNPSFVRYVASVTTLTLGVAMSMPFFGLTCRKYLHLSFVWVGVVTMVAGPIGGVLSARAWGRLIDRWGRRPVLMLTTAGLVLAVWGWLLIPPSGPTAADAALDRLLAGWGVVLPADHTSVVTIVVALAVTFYGGVIWTGVGQAQLNMILAFSDRGGRSTYAAVNSVIVAVAGVIGGLIGGLIADAAADLRLTIGGRTFVNYHLMFLLGGCIRAASLAWLLGVQDPGAKPARQFVRALGWNLLHSTILGPVRLVGWGVRRVSGGPKNAAGLADGSQDATENHRPR